LTTNYYPYLLSLVPNLTLDTFSDTIFKNAIDAINKELDEYKKLLIAF